MNTVDGVRCYLNGAGLSRGIAPARAAPHPLSPPRAAWDNGSPRGARRGPGRFVMFTPVDWLILVAYIAAVCGLGSLFYRRRASASDYFVGGRRMTAIPVAISLVAADMSAISYMGAPAWTFRHDLALIWSSWTYLLVAPVVMFLFLPFYSRCRVFTAYEYLERRFDLKTRLLGSALFLLIRGSHIAIVIYAPSLALMLITGLPLPLCVLAIGVCTTFYTTLGGMKAVIWTDVMQFTILVGGLLLVGWLTVTHVPGGLLGAWHAAAAGGRLRLFKFSPGLSRIDSFWACVIGGGFMALSTLGTDQSYLQRYIATRSLKEGQKSVLLDALIVVPVSLLLYAVGPVLFAFYHFHPAALHGLPTSDAVLPFFVVHQLAGWVPGLVIASIFAASMAVMGAGINSLTTATTVDFYKRLVRPNCDDRETVLVGRLGTVAWGAAATFGALFAGHLGPVINAFNKINSWLGGPILGIFLLGMLSRRARGGGAILGAVVGLAAVSWVALATDVAFFYYAVIGTVVTFGCGWLFSLFQPARSTAELAGLVRGLEAPLDAAPLDAAPLDARAASGD